MMKFVLKMMNFGRCLYGRASMKTRSVINESIDSHDRKSRF